MAGRGGQIVKERSYKEAAVTNLPADFNSTPPPNPRFQQLIESLKDLLALRPGGISVNEALRSCPLLSDPEMLKDHPSVRHLLMSFPEIVHLQGFSVQTRLFPASSNS
ncbi:hypothetical protein C0J45_14661 [Silurus meridionalis]|nr:hypothetical protein C0J45_14661 [Silurus meridionalis]